MLITKRHLKNIIKEELTRTVILREAKRYRKINGRLDENFFDDMSKKLGASKKAIAKVLAVAVAAGAFATTPAFAQDVGDDPFAMFGDMVEDALGETAPDASQVDTARSLELGKALGAQVLELLQSGQPSADTKLILDLQIGNVKAVGIDGSSYEKAIAAVLKSSYPNLEIDPDHSEPILSQKKIPEGTLIVVIDITPYSGTDGDFIDVIFSIKDAKDAQVLPSGEDPGYVRVKI